MHFISLILKLIFSRRIFCWQQLSNKCLKNLIWHLIQVSQLIPLNVTSKHSGCEFKYFVCYLLVKEGLGKVEEQENRRKMFD